MIYCAMEEASVLSSQILARKGNYHKLLGHIQRIQPEVLKNRILLA